MICATFARPNGYLSLILAGRANGFPVGCATTDEHWAYRAADYGTDDVR